MTIEISFNPWASFRAHKDKAAIHSWLQKVADASEAAFKAGMAGSSPDRSEGRYPAIRTGALLGSIKTKVSGDRMEIGTNTHYSLYLRDGTRKMDPRKMSPDALQDGMRRAGRLKSWAGWVRG